MCNYPKSYNLYWSYLDLNECLNEPGPCHTNATCTDKLGGFTCACKPGFTGNETMCKGREFILNNCSTQTFLGPTATVIV